ncbi:MAG: hypothetical protein HFH93_06440 [Lachnospiraceae bacterium]|nr:hypothetical protein [Lachnospiraceae bacterium]
MEALKKLYDFRELELPEQLFRLSWDPEAVEQALEDVRKRFVTIEETAGPVETGDFAVLELPESEGLEACRVQINVGKGFYDPAFEETLPGLMPGVAVTMPRRDGGRIGTLTQIKRRILPQLTDVLIARMGIEGVDTMDGYREFWKQKLLDQDKRKKGEAVYTMTMKNVVERSEFGDITAIVEKRLGDMKSQYREMARENNMEYEELLLQAVPTQYDTPEKREGFMRTQAEKQTRELLAAQCFARQEGKVFTREDFEAEKQKYLDMGLTRDQVEQRFTYENYLEGAPFEYYKDAIVTYFDKNFREVEQS